MSRIPFVILILAVLTVAACSRSKGPPLAGDYPLTRLTEHVYVIHGPNDLPTKQNQGFMNNPGFVLTAKGVVVIDPGSSVQIGEMVLKKITGVTKDPVIAVFNTHIHGDHWLGNDAIRAAYPKAVIYAHPAMRAKAAAEGENWLKLLSTLTDDATKGTRAVAPNMDINNDETLALGGKHFRIVHTGVAHTDGDIMIEVVEDRVLFAGDNIVAERTARMDDGHFKGNIAAVEAALKVNAKVIVPGHGLSGGREVADAYLGYLKTFHATVKKYLDQGMSDFDMKDKVIADLKPYQKWVLFDAEMGKLISLAYLQIEAEAF
ncbi:MAG: MBL fold metallo-hydrolase [Gammaproteobacteria bacterium]|nr:MBL fold metallo-hydrolase [Gammaproteobacteria bacterium]